MSRYKREIDTQCCNAWMQGIRTINGQYPDDNRDLTLTAGAGISITPETAGLRITNTAGGTVIAGDNIEITPSGDDRIIGLVSDPVINGDLQVNGDIIQNGSAYETHAEKVYTTNDYIITRDGAISALSAGDYSGFQVKKYDGTNDGRLVIDNGGVARVGDVGDEQPLLTRDESADLTNDNLLKWDGTNQKAVDAGFSYDDIDDALDTKVNKTQYNLDMASKVSGSGNIGTDTKPVKIVNGVAVPISADLAKPFSAERYAYITFNVASTPQANQWYAQSGNVTVSSGSPYFVANNNATIKVLQAGYYLIHARLLNNLSVYEGISTNGSISQNSSHGTEIVTIANLAANTIVTAALYSNTAGNGTFDAYNGLNRLEIIRL